MVRDSTVISLHNPRVSKLRAVGHQQDSAMQRKQKRNRSMCIWSVDMQMLMVKCVGVCSPLLGGTPWCFAKQRFVNGYTVTSTSDYDNGLLLSLSLTDGNALFGPDSQRLLVNGNTHTPSSQRVHHHNVFATHVKMHV